MKTEPRTLLVKLTEEERNERAMLATETLRARDNADSHAKLQAKLNKGAIVERRSMSDDERQSDLFQS